MNVSALVFCFHVQELNLMFPEDRNFCRKKRSTGGWCGNSIFFINYRWYWRSCRLHKIKNLHFLKRWSFFCRSIKKIDAPDNLPEGKILSAHTDWPAKGFYSDLVEKGMRWSPAVRCTRRMDPSSFCVNRQVE